MDEVDENGDPFYEFGQINILNIDTKRLDRQMIHVYPSADWEEDITDNGTFLFTDMADDHSLNVIMPWGTESFPYPLKDVFSIKSK